MSGEQNRQILLAARPAGMPKHSDFRLAVSPIPEPGGGELLIRIRYLSIDPYMRSHISGAYDYLPSLEIGDVLYGGAVGEVIESRNPDFATGEFVEGYLGWREYAVSDGEALRKIDPEAAPVSTALGILGMPGMTAYFGLLEIGKPAAGETLVVSAAAGAVGSAVGQIAKIRGCHTVGIAGSDAKIEQITHDLGFDAGINYKTTQDLGADLDQACPDGIDVYFDNVGGVTLDTIMSRLALGARIVICGHISQYNLTEPEYGPRNLRHLEWRRARMEGFRVLDYRERYPEGISQMRTWIQQGLIKYREDIVEGIENAPKALIRLLSGENRGKQLVRM